MFLRVLLLIVALLPLAASAASYKSGYGFEFKLPDYWVVVTPERLAQFKDKGLGIKTMDSKSEEQALKRVATGKIEYYFDSKHSTKKFTDNISVQGSVHAIPQNDDEAKAACDHMPAQLKAMYGNKVKIDRCGLQKAHHIAYMDYEYSGAAEGVTTIQNEFQLTPNLALVLVGASQQEGLAAMREGMANVREGISEYIKQSPDYSALLDKAIKAYNAGDYQAARKAFQSLAEVGDPDGLYNLGVMHARGQGGPKEPAKAMHYYRRAAELGNVSAMINLGSHYYYGDGVDKDLEEAARLYSLAARAGVPLAQRYYGVMLIKGEGVEQNVNEGANWLMQAALRGDELAGQNLERLLKPQVEKGNAEATHVLGLMYLQGVAGVNKDQAKGLGLLQRAAEAGHVKSQKTLAKIYAEGLYGVAKDPAKAKKWAAAAEKSANKAKSSKQN